MVLIFDGGEGGAHNTWDYVHVIDLDDEDQASSAVPDPAAPKRSEGADREPAEGVESGRPGWPLLGGVGVACLLTGVAAGAVAGRRRA
jgi:hypothetical protein